MVNILGMKINEVAIYLSISPRSIERYLSYFRARGRVEAKKVGRRICSLSIHPHIEFMIMEAILYEPQKTLAEIAQKIYQQTGADVSMSGIFYYLKRNGTTRKKVGDSVLKS